MNGTAASGRDELRAIFIGNYLPRRCGIATFTTDLHHAVAPYLAAGSRAVADGPGVVADASGVVAMNNTDEGYDYPDAVTFQINQHNLDDYRRAARFINNSSARVVCLQHEFGIFGGEAGDHISVLLAALNKPVVTTLHTMLERPEPHYRRALLEVIRYSDRLIVMSERAIGILRDVYAVPESQIVLIHHGTPDVPFTSPDGHKAQFGVEGRPVILTFGLLSPNKGIEGALEALPPVVERFPDVAYIVLGATHPEVRRQYGEGYRMYLEQKVRDLGLERNVLFHDRFVEIDELVQYLQAADVYLTPYLNREQIVSGTLAYAVATGRAVVSTPYWYAEELLADGRGVVVECGDTQAIGNALGRLLGDGALRDELRARTYAFGRDMIWREVGRRYAAELKRVAVERRELMLAHAAQRIMFSRSGLPKADLRHMLALTDDNGLFQHTLGHLPDLRHGYSADDMGRGLVVLSRAAAGRAGAAAGHDGALDATMDGYLAFLERAQTDDGFFHNFMDMNGRFLDERGSEDTFGRVLWGLGAVVGTTNDEALRTRAAHVLERAAPRIKDLSHARAMAYAICGLAEVLGRFENAHVLRHGLEHHAAGLVELYSANRDDGAANRDDGAASRDDGAASRGDEWHWFEDIVTYGNAVLPLALLEAYRFTDDEDVLACATESLDFLIRTQWNKRYFDFVGNEGWWLKNGPRAIFSQQPIEAGYMTAACAAAYEITGRERYLAFARRAFDWFFGCNRLGVTLYDARTGAVADGLDPQGRSRNRGAESAIAFLLALLSLTTLQGEQPENVSAEESLL